MSKNKTTYDKNRSLPYKNRSDLLVKQKSKCANSPGSNLRNMGNYECLLWKYSDGTFETGAGFEADHIVEYSLTKDTSISNIQLLCPNCHSAKTLSAERQVEKSIVYDYTFFLLNFFLQINLKNYISLKVMH